MDDYRPERLGKWEATKAHLWLKNKDGTPDIFAFSAGFCNGVTCRKCSKSFCVHCHPDWEDKVDECRIEHHVCSCCGHETLEKTAYCPTCGAKMEGAESWT